MYTKTKESPPMIKSRAGRACKYDWGSMEVGDCIKISDQSTSQYISIMTSLYSYKKRNKLKWNTTTRFSDNVVSIYRLEDEFTEVAAKKETVKKVKNELPTLDQVVSYFKENGYTEDAGTKAFNYYQSANWHDARGNKVKNWKQKMQAVWFKEENKVGSVALLFNNQIVKNDTKLGTSAARLDALKKW